MKRVEFGIALVVFVATIVHLYASIERYRPAWLGLVSLTMLVGTFATLVLHFTRRARDA